MSKIGKIKASTLLGMILSGPMMLMGGNVPQYTFSIGNNRYTEFTDGTAIPCEWDDAMYILFPEGQLEPNPHSGEGFPIGFDVVVGGRKVNQFAVSTLGDLYLGYGVVNYQGDAFRVGMSPMSYGLSKGEISYKTFGDVGRRVFYLQLKDVLLGESMLHNGKYSTQIRLYEEDGKIEIAFKEIDTTYNGICFDTGLRGWDNHDVLQLAASGLGTTVSISDKRYASILEPDTYIYWDQDDYDNYYDPVLCFTPSDDKMAPSDAPSNLTVEQQGNTLSISCGKGDNAAATVVLVSDAPFTDADLPKDGETFPVACIDENGKQQFPQMIGNALPLYYGSDKEISVTLADVKDNTSYYVKALSVSGYPAYGVSNASDVKVETTHSAPSVLSATPFTSSSILLDVESDYPVIVAMTTEENPGVGNGYSGLFGMPDADAAAGDELPGGGVVVYAGAPGQFIVDCEKNGYTYFRAWSVKDGVLSARTTDAAGVPTISMPYEPKLEYNPCGEQLLFWEATDGQFIPTRRPYKNDAALTATSTLDEECRLTFPALNLTVPSKLTFEFAIETLREELPTENGNDRVSQGSAPGQFGDTGYLSVVDGETEHLKVTRYSGSMTRTPDEDREEYEDGSSTFETVTVELPVLGYGKSVSLLFSTPGFTRLYIRNVKIEEVKPSFVPTLKSVDPVNGTKVGMLSSIETYWHVSALELDATPGKEIPVIDDADNRIVTTAELVSDAKDATHFTIRLKDPVKTAGKYTLEVPDGIFKYDGGVTGESIRLNYEVMGYTPLSFSYDGRYLTINKENGANVRYKIDDSDDWTTYSGPFDIGGLHTVTAESRMEDLEQVRQETYTTASYGKEREVFISEKGSLLEAVMWCSDSESNSWTDLTVHGYLSAYDYNWISTRQKLERLDLSDMTVDASHRIPSRALAGANVVTVKLPGKYDASSAEAVSTGNLVGSNIFTGCANLAALYWDGYVNGEILPVPTVLVESLSNKNLILYAENQPSVESVGNYVNNIVVNGVAERVTLTDEDDWYCPETFVAQRAIYVREFTKSTPDDYGCAGWETIVLPFDVTKVSHEKGTLISFGEDDMTGNLRYWLYAPETDNWKAATTIRANEPYLISMPNSNLYAEAYNIKGKVTFAGQNVTVPATPDDMSRVLWGDMWMTANYRALAAEESVMVVNDDWYEGNEPGSMFVAGLRDVRPFEAYLTGGGRKSVRIFDTSRVGELLAPLSLRVWSDRAKTVSILSGSDRRIRIYDTTGALVRVVDVRRGETTVVRDLAPGVYIVDRVKIII